MEDWTIRKRRGKVIVAPNNSGKTTFAQSNPLWFDHDELFRRDTGVGEKMVMTEADMRLADETTKKYTARGTNLLVATWWDPKRVNAFVIIPEATVAENKQQAELYKGIASENNIPIYESFQDASKALLGLESVPKSVLGTAKVREFPTRIEYTLGDSTGTYNLITLNHRGRVLHLDSFFYGKTLCPPDLLAAAKAKATAEGRTLGGLGMEWVQAVAMALGSSISNVSVDDGWMGPLNITSDHLIEAAKHLLDPTLDAAAPDGREALKRRMERVLGHDADPMVKTAYLKRVAAGGFYCQFNFHAEGHPDDYKFTAEPKDIIRLNTAM
jgi:hypothetical protein